MKRAALLVPFALFAACSPKGGAAGGSADSTATVASESTATVRDSATRDSVPRTDTTGAKSKATAPTKAGAVIGRDSAFGPKYIVDSTGKLIPIPQKRP